MTSTKDQAPDPAPQKNPIVSYVIYDGTGRIVQYGSCPSSILQLQATPGRYAMQGDGTDADHYVDLQGTAPAIMPLRPNPARQNGKQLTGLPVPCVIVINGRRYPCDEDHADLEFSFSGTYAVSVEAFPYLPASFKVSA